MCGIYVSLNDRAHILPSEEIALDGALTAACDLRGPDAHETVAFSISEDWNLQARLHASELRLRGTGAVVQPHRDPAGNILCWNGEVFDGLEVGAEENDGVKLLLALADAQSPEDVVRFFSRIEGPYAVVYYQAASRRLYYARDCLGRRSLLVHYPTVGSPCFLLASVSAGADNLLSLEELDTGYIHFVDLRAWAADSAGPSSFGSHRTLLPRAPMFDSGSYAGPADVDRELPPANLPICASLAEEPEHLAEAWQDLISHLDRSVSLRVRDIPPIPSQARLAVLFSGGIDCTVLAYFAHQHMPLDEPIDLLNVAFENPRKERVRSAAKSATDLSPYLVPDRISGLVEVDELQRVCSGRTWNFVEINVAFTECQEAQPTVEALMFPRNTVMDLSLANALYFASRGIGLVRCAGGDGYVPYASKARVLLSGLGSDELLGGYGRHRNTFKCGSWPALIDELQTEIARLPTRNLGRDDRVISAHGKECRYPFLSLNVVNFLAGLPVHAKTDPRATPGVGDKLLLRLAARRLGLVEASGRHKKAMQFGSHSARMLGGAGDKKGHLLIT